jgi:bacterioferritin
MVQRDFLSDIQEIRRRARENAERGAVTENYQGDLNRILALLNDALATELVCVLRYKMHAFMARGIHAEPVAREFREHAAQEQAHADRIADRITQLGGEPNFNPDGLASRSHSEYSEAGTLVDMIRENLIAERIAIDTYSEIIRFIGDKDPTTRRMLEEILSMEEGHADDLARLFTWLRPEWDEERRKSPPTSS